MRMLCCCGLSPRVPALRDAADRSVDDCWRLRHQALNLGVRVGKEDRIHEPVDPEFLVLRLRSEVLDRQCGHGSVDQIGTGRIGDRFAESSQLVVLL